MGDKSQLASLAFASRVSARLTLAGVAVATLLVHLLSTFLGEALGLALPTDLMTALAGVAFIAFGVWTLRGDTYVDEGSLKLSRLGPFLSITLAFLLAELGDKTMLATITLGSQLNSFVGVWLGSTLGMVAADGLAIALGIVFGRRIPQRATR